MEFVSGYRDPLVEYSEVLFSWYHCYLLDRSDRLHPSMIGGQKEEEQPLKQTLSCWFLHILHNDQIHFKTQNIQQQNQDGFYTDNVLRPQDLSKYIRMVNKDSASKTKKSGDDLHQIEHLLIVADASGMVLGVDFMMASQGYKQTEQHMLETRAFCLLRQCMERPMGGGAPHQPQRVVVEELSLLDFLDKHLSFMGIEVWRTPLQGWIRSVNFFFSTKTVQCCHVCKRRAFEVALRPCDKCGAVLYCSDRCQSQDWRKGPQDASHEYWCDRMKQFMKRENELADLPFQFSKDSTSRTFDKEHFLSSQNLTGGCWSSESIYYSTNVFQNRDAAPSLEDVSEHFNLLTKDMEALKEKPKERLQRPIGTWKEYYDWRGLSLSDPIATLLTYPLTIYHVISVLIPQHFPELSILRKQSLKIHIMEVRLEHRNLLLFWELAVLMPQVALQLVFVGTELPVKLHGRSFIIHKEGCDVICSDVTSTNERGGRGIQVKVHAHPYHSLQGPKPDIVIGFNSGFGLNDSWLSILPRLQAMNVPAYFTDCSQYSCDVDEQVVSWASGGAASLPILNPFRSPLRIGSADNNMPWYNNAFLFYLIYKTGRDNKRRNNQTHAQIATPTQAIPEPIIHKKARKAQRNRDRKRK
ncbi:zinc finger MYND domain-containing protein 15 [Mantella aurantiaca]